MCMQDGMLRSIKHLVLYSHQFYPNNIKTEWKEMIMGINSMTTSWKMRCILYQIITTYFLRKCIEISTNKLNVDIGALRVICVIN